MLTESIDDNLRFLVREVEKQVARTQQLLVTQAPELKKALFTRDNYIDNLRTFIQTACFTHAAEGSQIAYLRAVDVIAINLERIADFCEDVVKQLDYLRVRELLDPGECAPFFEEILRAVGRIEEAVGHVDVHVALSICRAEPRLDQLYEAALQRCIAALRDGHEVESQVTLLLIWHYFERMGDSLLNIGEAVISAALGEKIKIGQLWALEDSLSQIDPKSTLEQFNLELLGESRSGCHITRVSSREREDIAGTAVIFKEGNPDKLREERDGICAWERLAPGVAPKIFSFHDNAKNSALLLEFLPGRTFEEILLSGRGDELAGAYTCLTRTMRQVWNDTRTDEPGPSRFSRQLNARLPDIFAIHPRFETPEHDIGSIRVPPFARLVQQAIEAERALTAPFATLTHGDFNVDNIIWEAEEDRARLIDLHRSRLGDYVQDVSVFLVSNFRLQIFEAPMRVRIARVIADFLAMAGEFAERAGDHQFGARLAFGLARSFATSTRFILDEAFAHGLFLRARFLLDRLVATPSDQLPGFQIPLDILSD